MARSCCGGSRGAGIVRSWVRWLLLSLAFALAALARAETAQLALSESERAWIATHPLVEVGLAGEFPPYYLRDASGGQVHGYLIETMSLWAQRAGMRLHFRAYEDAAALRAALASGEVDMTPLLAQSPAEDAGLLRTQAAYMGDLVIAARRDVPDVSPSQGFAAHRVAVVAGSSAEALFARTPDTRTVRFDSAEAALRALSAGEVELFVGYQHVAVYEIERQLLANVELRASLGAGPVTVGPAVGAHAPPLRDILEKAMASVTAADRSRLAQRWLPAGSAELAQPGGAVQLSEAERAWAARSPGLRIGYDAAFSPVTRTGPLGDFQGYGADLIRLIAQKSGLNIKQETGSSFADTYRAGQRGEVDVVVGMARSAQRRADFDFIGPFLSLPTVLVTRASDAEPVADARDIGRRRLALLRGHFLIPELRVRYPGIVLREYDHQQDVLSAVIDGEAEVALGNLSVINELIERRFPGRLTITGVVKDGDSELYLAVPRQYPELTRILSRGFEAVSDSETAALRARWLAREVRTGYSWEQVLRVVLPVIAVLLGYLFLLARGNWRLRRARAAERRAREAAEESIAARGRFLAYLSHELRGTLDAVSAGAQLLKQNDDAVLRGRLLDAIGRSAGSLLNVLDTTLRHEQSLATPLVLEPVTIDLQAWWDETVSPARIAAECKGLRFVDSRHGEAQRARVDAVRLQQVVHNLLNNAIKFTSRGEVRARCEAIRREGGAELRIEISDTGPGLTEADRASLFKAYAQGEQGRLARQGAGLGLAISAQIVHALRGRLEAPGCESGSRFVLSVPVGLVSEDLSVMPATVA